MSEQTSERARSSRWLHVPAFARRSASSTDSAARSDSTMLKRGLDGIKDRTTRLTIFLRRGTGAIRGRKPPLVMLDRCGMQS